MISKLNWIQNAINICFFQTYLWIRGFDLWKTSTEQTPIFISLGAYFILFPLFLCLKEREEKRLFTKNEVLHGRTNFFEKFVRKTIPSSVLIFSKKELKFFNEKTMEIFSASSKEEIIRNFKSLKVNNIFIQSNWIYLLRIYSLI